jgi:hypothetical protein
MGCPEGSDAPASRNPNLETIEFGALIASVEMDLDAIRLELVDPVGRGCAALLSADQALDATLKLIGAMHRLRRLEGSL